MANSALAPPPPPPSEDAGEEAVCEHAACPACSDCEKIAAAETNACAVNSMISSAGSDCPACLDPDPLPEGEACVTFDDTIDVNGDGECDDDEMNEHMANLGQASVI
jgi:hypothetical protein